MARASGRDTWTKSQREEIRRARKLEKVERRNVRRKQNDKALDAAIKPGPVRYGVSAIEFAEDDER